MYNNSVHDLTRASTKGILIKIGKGIAGIVVVVLVLWLGMSAQKKQEAKFPWRGSVFGTAGDSSTIRATDEFKTVDECRTWAKKKEDDLTLNSSTRGFTCGTGCVWKENSIVSGRQVKQYECSEIVTE